MEPVFESANPRHSLRLNFGASSQLRAQIEQGAPADVFASADGAQMEPLVRAKLADSPVVFARNRLTVVVPTANPGKLRSSKDLARPRLRLVTTAENVPIGRYTAQVLGNLAKTRGYPADFAERVNANVVSREANVRTVLAKVELGEADAAVVYETDAKASRRVRSLSIPPTANVVAEYPIAVVAGSRNAEGAERFLRFVRSPAGARILRRHGFR
jgi:molybdate transport system substrate-binding protein